jgi:hypothetical protein
MAWLLFLDESGHDHKQMPYEVRGGVALQDSQLWPFALAMQRLERDAFVRGFRHDVSGASGGFVHLLRELVLSSTVAGNERAGSRGDSL